MSQRMKQTLNSDLSKLRHICSRQKLHELDYLVEEIEYKKQSYTTIVFYFEDKLYAYLNHCMHMQRRLDCQQDKVFDKERKRLRCSMHGFVFEPMTGECLSPVCMGLKLTALKVKEIDGQIFFSDKYVQLTC